MNKKQMSISLETITLPGPTINEANTAWECFGAVVNAKYESGNDVIKLERGYFFNEVIGRTVEINRLEFAR